MTKNIFRRILSVASALAIVFTAYPPVIFADDGGLCPHHPEHTAECGYVEGVSPCNFVCEICDLPEASDSTEPSDTPEPEVTTSPEEQPPVTTAPEPEPAETVTTETMPEESETMPTEPMPEPDSSPAEPEIQLMAVNEEHVEHDNITDWQAWSDPSSLPTDPGNYYLTTNVTLSATWEVPSGGVNLCLNGNQISTSNRRGSIQINTGSSLTVYDCQNVGQIISENTDTVYIVGGQFNLKGGNVICTDYTDAAINVFNSGVVTIDGGAVKSNADAIKLSYYSNATVLKGSVIGNNHGISVDSDCTVTIRGGYIEGTKQYAVNATYGKIILSGNPQLKGRPNYFAGGELSIRENPITIDQPLTGGPFSVDKSGGGIFAIGDYAVQSRNCFIPAYESEYIIVENGDQLELVKPTPHIHDDLTEFQPWVRGDSLPTTAGNYYLTEDVTLNGYWDPKYTVNLCLNGFKITVNSTTLFNIYSDDHLTVYDCRGGGEIDGNAAEATINSGSTGSHFTLESGKISNNNSLGSAISVTHGEVIINGGEVKGSNNGISISNGTVSITDGIITAERNYAVNAGNGTLTLSGQPELDGYEADIYIFHKFPINISDLTNTEPYSVEMDTPGVFATVDGGDAKDYVKNFTSANDDYTVVAEGNTLKLVERHIHDDGKEFTAWTKNNELPSEAGSYFLTTDVTLSANWDVSSDITLCLNGQTVNCGGNQITVGSGSSLTVYDDLGKNGEIRGSSDKTIYVNGGKFTLKSGKIFNDNSNWDAVRVDNSGTASIQGGTVEATGQAIHGVSDSSVINVTDGEIKGGSGSLIFAIHSYGTLKISGGNITSAEDNAVRITSDDSNFNLSGSPVIDGIQLDGRAVITIDKALSGQYVVYGSGVENQVFAQGSRAAEAKDCFKLPQDLQDEGYVIVAVENGLKATILHSHEDGTEFEALDYKSDFPDKAGKYFLADMGVSLEDTWVVPEGETTLCLNGNMIMNSDQSIDIPKNATLIICDCSRHSSGGIIFENAACINVSGELILKSGTIMNGLSGKAINVGSTGSLIIEDGTVSGYDCAIHGESGSDIIILNGDISGDQGPAISTGGNLTVSGGRLTGNISYGIDVTGKLTLAGNPEIIISTRGTLTSADIHVTKPIIIPAQVSGESYSVYMVGAPCVFAKGDGAAESFECFTSANSDYEVQKVGSELWLVPKGAHVHEDDGTIFLPWDKDNSLPDSAGNWYLKQPVTLTGEWTVPGDVNLCLNGQTVSCGGNQVTVGSGSSLTVYDDLNKNGEIAGDSSRTIYVDGGTFTLKNGKISNNSGKAISIKNGTVTIEGGIVESGIEAPYNGSITVTGGEIKGGIQFASESGTLTISGGTITGGAESLLGSCAVLCSTNNSFNLSGEPIIKGEDCDIALQFGTINIENPLTGGPYSVNIIPYGVFATGDGAAASIDRFKLTAELESAGYEIAIEGDALVARLKTYTIKYESGEGSDISGEPLTETKTHGKDITISDKKFTRPGYTQTG